MSPPDKHETETARPVSDALLPAPPTPAATVGRSSRWLEGGILGAVCALVIGLYLYSAQSGFLESLSSNVAGSYYNLLVQGFRAGQLNANREVPAGLAQLPNPYDPAAHGPYLWQDPNYLFDLSYYQGKLYLYWGVTPVLLLFWPAVAWTGHYLLHREAVVIFCALGFLAGVGLLRAVWRRYFDGVNVWVVGACAVGLGLVSGQLWLVTRAEVYEVAISCGYLLTMLALGAVWCALHQPGRRGWWLAGASLAYGLAVGARPSLLFGAVLLLVPVAQGWVERRRIWPLVLAAAGPITAIGCGIMAYNYLRFDNALEFGQRYQLTGIPQYSHKYFNLAYLWFNFRLYFLAPAEWTGHFPFVKEITLSSVPAGMQSVESPYGILSNLPVVWLALAAPLAWRGRPLAEGSRLRWFLTAVLLLFGVNALILCLFSGVCLRFETEFLFPLMLLSVTGILGLERGLADRPMWRRGARWIWGGLLSVSVVLSLLTAVVHYAESYFSQGRFLMKIGRPESAIRQFEQALRIRPDYAEAQAHLGMALMREGRVKEATEYFQKAVRLQPNFTWAYNNLGTALIEVGRFEEAKVQFEKALQVDGNSVKGHYNLGRALENLGRREEAMAHYRAALRADPQFVEAYRTLGMALLMAVREDEAITQFREALRLSPGDAAAEYHLAVLLARAGRVEEALAHGRAAVQADPGFAEAHQQLGELLVRAGDKTNAVAQWREAERLRPGWAPPLNSLAWLMATDKETAWRNGAEAVALAEAAVRGTTNRSAGLLDTLAAAYAESGRYGEAVATAQTALDQAVAAGDDKLAAEVRMRLETFQSGKPWREQ